MKEQFNIWIFGMAMLVSIGGLLYGYDIGVISGALLFIHQSISLSSWQTGFIVGAVLLGGWAGALIAGPLADFAGRRIAILSSAALFIVGVGFIVSSHSFATLMLARILLGLGVGVLSVAVPLYVGELVPGSQRGRYMTMFQLFLTFGIVAAYFVDLLFTSSGNWRGMFEVVFIPAAILFVGALFLPESPRWLISKGQVESARKTLSLTFAANTIDLAVERIKNSMQKKEPSFFALFSPAMVKVTLLAVSIAVLNQWTGINSFLQYAPDLLKKAGMSSNAAAMMASAGIGSMNFVVTLIALFLIDKVGRKTLLVIGTFGVFASEVFLASLGHMHLTSVAQGMYTLYGLIGFIVFFAIGPGVVVWLAMSELFPTQIRGRGLALCLFVNGLAGWALASGFVKLTNWLGMSGMYMMCAIATFVYLLIAVFLLPETKGMTLEEVQDEVEISTDVVDILPVEV